MRPEEIDPDKLEQRAVGPVTIFFGLDQGKYPYGNSLSVTGRNESIIIDPSLGMVSRRGNLPVVDRVVHSHTHEDHIAGTHLFRNMTWHAHREDALGLESLDGLMKIFGAEGDTFQDFRSNIETQFYYPHGGPADGVVHTFEDQDVFDLGDVTITVLHTPGHTRGHCCFLIEWGDSSAEKLVYLGDIELTGFGPYYGDAWSDLEDFERSIESLRYVDADWWLTFHHKGLIESRARFLEMLETFSAMIDDREDRLLKFLASPRSMQDIVEHRFVYRPGQTGDLINSIERRSMGMHLERLQLQGVVIMNQNKYVRVVNE